MILHRQRDRSHGGARRKASTSVTKDLAPILLSTWTTPCKIRRKRVLTSQEPPEGLRRQLPGWTCVQNPRAARPFEHRRRTIANRIIYSNVS